MNLDNLIDGSGRDIWMARGAKVYDADHGVPFELPAPVSPPPPCACGGTNGMPPGKPFHGDIFCSRLVVIGAGGGGSHNANTGNALGQGGSTWDQGWSIAIGVGGAPAAPTTTPVAIAEGELCCGGARSRKGCMYHDPDLQE